jgi:hypothetical protein
MPNNFCKAVRCCCGMRNSLRMADPGEAALGRAVAMATGARPCAGFAGHGSNHGSNRCHRAVLERVAGRIDPANRRSLWSRWRRAGHSGKGILLVSRSTQNVRGVEPDEVRKPALDLSDVVKRTGGTVAGFARARLAVKPQCRLDGDGRRPSDHL